MIFAKEKKLEEEEGHNREKEDRSRNDEEIVLKPDHRGYRAHDIGLERGYEQAVGDEEYKAFAVPLLCLEGHFGVQGKIVYKIEREGDDIALEVPRKSEHEGCEEPGDKKIESHPRSTGQKKVEIFVLEKDCTYVGNEFVDHETIIAKFLVSDTLRFPMLQ